MESKEGQLAVLRNMFVQMIPKLAAEGCQLLFLKFPKHKQVTRILSNDSESGSEEETAESKSSSEEELED